MRYTDIRKALRFYAVTDTGWAAKLTLKEQVEAALQGGVSMVQLREKTLPQAAFLHKAIELKKLTEQYDIPLIINDNLDIAVQSNAAGLHIGQSDGSITEIRQSLGTDKILGVSTQTVEQALYAEAAGADYLGVGAIFPTNTKNDAEIVGLETLSAICRAVKIPVVAIGGINEQNIPSLLPCGIAGVALVSAVFAAPNITESCRKIDKLLNT